MKDILLLIFLFICLLGPAGILFIIILIFSLFAGTGDSGSASDYITLYSSHHEYGPEDDEWGEANTDGWCRPCHFDDDW